MIGRRSTPHLWAAVAATLRGYRLRMVVAAACLLGAIAADLLAPWPLKIVVDQLLLDKPAPRWLAAAAPVLDHQPVVALALLSLVIVGLASMAAALTYLQTYLTARIGHDVVHGVRHAVFERLSRLSPAFYSSNHSAELLTRVGSDTALIRDVFTDWAVKALSDTILIVGILAVMLVMDWRLALCVMFTLPLLYMVLRRIGSEIRASARAQRKQDAALAVRLSESLGSMTLVQAFGREAHEIARFDAQSLRSRDAGVSNARASAAMSKSVTFMAAVATAGTVLAGGVLALRGTLTPGDLLIFLAYVAALFKPVRDLGKLWAKLSRARVGAERLEEVLRQEPGAVDEPDAVVASGLRGAIEFDAVSFAYPTGSGTGPNILADARLSIAAGEHVAVVGQSGAGKSTLLQLLLRLYEPTSGSIRIDGRALPGWTLHSLRQEIGVVMQEAVFVGSTIRENIAWGTADATETQITRAARLAGALDMIAALPAGLDTVVGERGCTLSGGQRQRICLARTLIRDPSILILDEPTSAVDPESVEAIERTVTEHRRGRTTLVIGHQFTSFDRFDRVIEVRQGRLVDITLRARRAPLQLLNTGGQAT